jgi:hypothetical protein
LSTSSPAPVSSSPSAAVTASKVCPANGRSSLQLSESRCCKQPRRQRHGHAPHRKWPARESPPRDAREQGVNPRCHGECRLLH